MARLFLEMLQLPVVTQAAHVGLFDSGIVGARVPDALDRLGQADVVRLEFVQTDAHHEGGEDEEVVEGFSDAGHLPLWDVVCYYGPKGWVSEQSP